MKLLILAMMFLSINFAKADGVALHKISGKAAQKILNQMHSLQIQKVKGVEYSLANFQVQSPAFGSFVGTMEVECTGAYENNLTTCEFIIAHP